MKSQVIIGYAQGCPESRELAALCATVLEDFKIPRTAIEGLSAARSVLDADAVAVIWIAPEALELTELLSGSELPVFAVPLIADGPERYALQMAMTESGAGTLAIGAAGAKNAALAVAALVARWDPQVRENLAAFRRNQTASVLAMTLPDE